jgi:hypothetical protein
MDEPPTRNAARWHAECTSTSDKEQMCRFGSRYDERGKPMTKLLVLLAAAVPLPAIAATSAPIWDDEGGQLRFDDSALGTWCYAKNNQMKDAKVYERSQNCKPPDWIVLGPNGYRTINRTCSMTSIGRAGYHKNVVVAYRCEEFETKRIWLEQVEMGFTSTDFLYITTRISAPSQ